jgi:hypothetical protein
MTDYNEPIADNGASVGDFLASEVERLRADRYRLRKFAEFVLKWCDRGPPHGGPGNEAFVLEAIRYHPVLSAMRKDEAAEDIERLDADLARAARRLSELAKLYRSETARLERKLDRAR